MSSVSTMATNVSMYSTLPYDLVVPAGTSRPNISRLHAEIALALSSPDIGARLAAEGSEPGGITPDEFAAYSRREIVKWAKVVKASGAKAD